MNQHPNMPGVEHDAAWSTDAASGPTPPSANPYYAHQQAQVAHPDLDAGAALLQSGEMQRLNRKALVFLAGIVGLLVTAAIFMVRSATAGGSDDPPRAVEQEVTIPELPRESAAEEHMPAGEDSELPPLPVESLEPGPAELQPFPDSSQGMPREPTLMERRMANAASAADLQPSAAGVPGLMSPEAYARAMMAASGQEGAQAAPKEPRVVAGSAQPLGSPDTLLLRGTYIRCVMETRIVTDVAGFTSCVVTEPVYSVNGRRLLLPKGSKISGTYENANITGPRVAVIWDRITTPTGIDVNMASPGVDNLGGAGHPGDYNAHWASRVSSALLISLIGDAFKYAAAKNGPETTVVTNSGTAVMQPYESNTARAMERLANEAVDRSLHRPPTVTINQGTVVNVYVARDVDFSPVLR